ncbi:nuclear body protein SP140-like protein isoform X3 [Boleophthalmus pectinirostris]|uniref:nuclear body protein SP140-like protein isoform X3 n=1 Tax=Boleophthalmus pectinirostris TaxID=150288 RepID=UPI00242DE247|nr:nuclear body protein SP140-like protein isoform X3 [Boleophthalmus pectinirostris]
MANPVEFIEREILLSFLENHKKKLSCMKNPLTFVRQLRDNNLITEDIYKKIEGAQNPEPKLALEWIQTTKKLFIHRFWSCVFEKHIIDKYPTVRELQRKLFKNFLEEKPLLGFLHINKTKLSCMENPQTFVSQLRDYNLISKDQHSKISRMKSKERIRSEVYSVLDFIETKRPESIKRFWSCVFKETILNKYPTLRLLRNSLFDGSYASALLEVVESDDTDKEKMSEEEMEVNKVELKSRKKRKKTTDDDEEIDDEQPPTSTQVTPRLRKKSKKLCFSTPLKKGEKGDIWTKVQLPVTCGDLKGTLNRDRLAKGEKCILVNGQWYTPPEFERRAGKEAYKNWKLSIYCRDTPLIKLIQEGHLKTIGFSMVKKHLFPSEETTTVTDTEDASGDSSSRESSSDSIEEHEQDDEDGLAQLQSEPRNIPHRVLKVVCEDITGLLHTKRFASGTCGKSIRTESSWMTPVDFVKEASCQTDISWQKHIKCEGKPLGELLKDRERNDDECWVCHGEGTLVECDECPRSFHQECHLPHITDALLGDDTPWMCTSCVLFRSLVLYPELEMEEAMSRPISDHMQHCQHLLLGLYRADEDNLFKSDPCHLPEYTKVISTPMCFDQVADNLQNNRYQTVGDFVSDIDLIFTNCASYNRDNPEFLSIGTTIKEIFQGELNTVFKIQQVASEEESESESEILLFIPQGDINFAKDMQPTSE